MVSANQPVPFCVDCDGTLLKTDLLHEALLLLFRQSPKSLLLLPIWLLQGRAKFKEQIAERVSFNWPTLPYREEILTAAKMARAEGRKVVLATASPKVWAHGVADHLGLFDAVLATEGEVNLGGEQKAQRLSVLYGERAFEYAGNSISDLPVWRRACTGIVVSSSPSLIKAAKLLTTVDVVVPVERANFIAYMRAMRVHQWLKNVLIWVPLFAAHEITHVDSAIRAALAFLAFSLCASGVYVINDLLDLESDRQHIRKRKRSFASGLMPVSRGVILIPVCLIGSIGLASLLPGSFALVLALYFVLTLAYSLRLKRQIIVDVTLLAILYTVRIIAGAAAIAIMPTFWLLALSMFIFLSLAMVKRYSEMLIVLRQNSKAAAGRGYSVNDLPVLMSLGASSGMAAVLVLALYINSPETRSLYPSTIWLWGAPPLLLYWISRIWMKTHRGEIDDDPLVFAAFDWQSLVTVFLLSLFFILAR